MFKTQNSKPYGAYQATLMTPKEVIPAPYQVRGKLQQESRKHWIPGQARNDGQNKGTFDALHYLQLRGENV
jgi:hypothetical protein